MDDINNPHECYTTAKINIINEYGIHARPSSLICKTASKYAQNSFLTYVQHPQEENIDTTQKFNCKSIFDLLSMGAPHKSIIKLHVEGTNEESKKICTEIAELISSDLETIITKINKEGT